MFEPVHEDLLRAGALAAVGGDEEHRWLDCELASLAENRLRDPTHPRDLDDARRARWRAQATIDPLPLPSARAFERCYWIVDRGQRAGTIALATSTLGGKLLHVSSLYVLPELRGQGVARRALERVRDALAVHDRGLRLDTMWTWQRAVRFYLGIGMWVRMWKRDLVFCWEPWTPAPRVEVSERSASLSVPLGDRHVVLARAARDGDRLEMNDAPEARELQKDKRIGEAYWHAWSTLSLAVALEGWPLIRSREAWSESYFADAGAPESLAHKIMIWEAWDAEHGWAIETPRVAGLEYPTWAELEAQWKEESARLAAERDRQEF